MDYLLVLIFIYGLVFGSFNNVVALRMLKNETISGRSYCPTCKTTLRWYNLIPVISWILQGGKCTNCKEKVSPIYPAFELLTGLSYAFIYYKFGLSLTALGLIVVISVLLTDSVSDLRERTTNANLSILGYLAVALLMFFEYKIGNFDAYYSNIILAIFVFVFMYLLAKTGMIGDGDGYILALVAIVFGGWNLLIMITVTSNVFLIYYSLKKIIKNRSIKILNKEEFPLVPFMYFGTMLTLIIL